MNAKFNFKHETSTAHLSCNEFVVLVNWRQSRRSQLRNQMNAFSHLTRLFSPSACVPLSLIVARRSYEPSDRTLFDESSINYADSHADRRIECGDIPGGESSLILMKSEPLGESSPESMCELSSSPDDCAGCGHPIQVNIKLSSE